MTHEVDRQSSLIKSLHLRMKTSAQNHEELSSKVVQLQIQVTANTESQKLLQHLTGIRCSTHIYNYNNERFTGMPADARYLLGVSYSALSANIHLDSKWYPRGVH